jgi:RNA polymerase sigma-70 factor (ECF subfamily)
VDLDSKTVKTEGVSGSGVARVFFKSSNEFLISELLRQTETGYELLYDKYAAGIFGILSKMVSSKEVAEDILSKVFHKVSVSLSTYDPNSTCRIFTWLVKLAKLEALEYLKLKQNKRRQNLELINTTMEPAARDPSLESNSSDTALKQLAGALNSQQRLLVDLVYLKGYTTDQISKEFGIPLNAVKIRLRAAINALRLLFNCRE